MVSFKRQGITGTGPVFTTGLILLSIMCSVSSYMREVLIYEREAILSGEVWRLITGHFIHLSKSHLLNNMLLLGVAGWIIEANHYAYYGRICMLSSLIIGLALLLWEPEMCFYGGMSGVACTSILYLCLMKLHEPGTSRPIYLLILIVSLFKIGFERYVEMPIFVSQDTVPFRLVPLAHVTGALTALGGYLWCKRHSEKNSLRFLMDKKI